METVAERGTMRGTLQVRRDDGTVLADWSDSGCGTGRVTLRVHPRSRHGAPVSIPMNTLEALELCMAGRLVRDAELRIQGRADVGSEAVQPLEWVDVMRFEIRLRARTMEWMGTSLFCPASFALAMACCGIPAIDPAHPDTLRALERCVAYLAAVPEARPRLHRAGRLSESWALIVAHWEELESGFLAECGAGFCRSAVGSRTEWVLREVLAK